MADRTIPGCPRNPHQLSDLDCCNLGICEDECALLVRCRRRRSALPETTHRITGFIAERVETFVQEIVPTSADRISALITEPRDGVLEICQFNRVFRIDISK